MQEIQTHPELSLIQKWMGAKSRLEWFTFLKLNALDITPIVHAVEQASFPKPANTSVMPPAVVAYINGNPALKEVAKIVAGDPQEKRVQFWIELLCTEVPQSEIEKGDDELTLDLDGELGLLELEEGVDETREALWRLSNAPEQLQVHLSNAEMAEEVRNGNLGYLEQMTEMTPETARTAVDVYKEGLRLKLVSITPEIAGILKKSEARNLDLDELTSLTPEIAKELAEFKGSLTLRGIKQMDVRTANELARHRGEYLSLGLNSITPDVAEALSHHAGANMFLGGPLFITQEIGQAICKYQGRLSFSPSNELSAQTARLLAARKGDEFIDNKDTTWKISGFKTPDVKAEQERNRTADTQYRDIDKLTEITPEMATAYMQRFAYETPELKLSIRTLTPEVATALTQGKCILHLSWVRTISKEVADILGRYKHGPVILGLTSLTQDVAEALGQHDGLLHLPYLEQLDPKSCALLCKTKKMGLSLASLDAITPDVAKILAEQTDQLSISNLRSLSPAIAKILAEHHSGHSLALQMESISPETAQALTAHKGFDISLELGKIGVSEAEALAGCKRISLRLNVIDAKTAQALAKNEGSLCIHGIYSLPIDIAEALSHHAGYNLTLDITSLNAETAREIAKIRGSLSLYLLDHIDEETAKELAKHNKAQLHLSSRGNVQELVDSFRK